VKDLKEGKQYSNWYIESYREK